LGRIKKAGALQRWGARLCSLMAVAEAAL